MCAFSPDSDMGRDDGLASGEEVSGDEAIKVLEVLSRILDLEMGMLR